jgi:hypothetical protein
LVSPEIDPTTPIMFDLPKEQEYEIFLFVLPGTIFSFIPAKEFGIKMQILKIIILTVLAYLFI